MPAHIASLSSSPRERERERDRSVQIVLSPVSILSTVTHRVHIVLLTERSSFRELRDIQYTHTHSHHVII